MEWLETQQLLHPRLPCFNVCSPTPWISWLGPAPKALMSREEELTSPIPAPSQSPGWLEKFRFYILLPALLRLAGAFATGEGREGPRVRVGGPGGWKPSVNAGEEG